MSDLTSVFVIATLQLRRNDASYTTYYQSYTPALINRDPARLAEAQEVMAHVRVLRQQLLGTSVEPIRDQERSGLTGPQISVMTYLVLNGPATVTELSRELRLSHSTTSGVVDRLQARGLVHRTRDDHDRRYTRISGTGIVEEYVRELDEGPFGRLAAALERAIPEQRRTIRDGLELLRKLLA